LALQLVSAVFVEVLELGVDELDLGGVEVDGVSVHHFLDEHQLLDDALDLILGTDVVEQALQDLVVQRMCVFPRRAYVLDCEAHSE